MNRAERISHLLWLLTERRNGEPVPRTLRNLHDALYGGADPSGGLLSRDLRLIGEQWPVVRQERRSKGSAPRASMDEIYVWVRLPGEPVII